MPETKLVTFPFGAGTGVSTDGARESVSIMIVILTE